MPTVGTGRAAVYDLDQVNAWLVRTGRGSPSAPTAPSSPAGDPVERLERASAPSALPPPPSAAEERALAVEARGRSWLIAAAATRDVQKRMASGDLEPSPAQAEALARAARTLSEAVRGDAGEESGPLTLREALVEALVEWLAQWGAEGLEAILVEARARTAP